MNTFDSKMHVEVPMHFGALNLQRKHALGSLTSLNKGSLMPLMALNGNFDVYGGLCLGKRPPWCETEKTAWEDREDCFGVLARSFLARLDGGATLIGFEAERPEDARTMSVMTLPVVRFTEEVCRSSVGTSTTTEGSSDFGTIDTSCEISFAPSVSGNKTAGAFAVYAVVTLPASLSLTSDSDSLSMRTSSLITGDGGLASGCVFVYLSPGLVLATCGSMTHTVVILNVRTRLDCVS